MRKFVFGLSIVALLLSSSVSEAGLFGRRCGGRNCQPVRCVAQTACAVVQVPVQAAVKVADKVTEPVIKLFERPNQSCPNCPQQR